jgi:MFS family permease
LPQIVPRERFSNAVAWNTGAFHMASALGPALAGLLIALYGSPIIIYLLDAVAAGGFFALLAFIQSRPVATTSSESSPKELAAGLAFLRRSPVILGAITLDMFAVLLGGAITLLPVYASKEILNVGPTGYGWMRAAPAVGALAMSILLAHRPPLERAGRALLWSVAGFGVATIVFGLSRSFWLSLVTLLVTGALDNISVVVRHTLVQVLTPDELRGRVSAVNGLFIGASNELGGFESGLVAELFNPTISVVSGGIGTLLVVATVAVVSPPLRRYGRLGTMQAEEEKLVVGG